MLDPTIIGALTAALEKTINAALRYDPGTRTQLVQLAGRVLAIESTFPAVTLYLLPQAENDGVALAVQAYCEAPVDTHLKGPLLNILSLTLGSQHSLAGSGVTLEGDPGLLQRFQDVLGHIDVDWEEPVNDLLGPALGHGFSELIRRQLRWNRDSISKTQRFATDYLVEELRATPAKLELEGYYSAVDQLRADVDRLSARVFKLRKTVAQTPEQGD